MRSWKALTVASVSGLLALYSAGLLYEGYFSERYRGLLTRPFVDKPAAERALDRLPSNAPPAQRAAASQRLVDGDPTDPEGWNAVAYADWRAHDGLSAVGLRALDRSYTVSFFDRPQAVWRVAFAAQSWASLTPDLRSDAMTEAEVALHDPSLGPQLRSQLQAVQTPAGRVAGALMLAGNNR